MVLLKAFPLQPQMCWEHRAAEVSHHELFRRTDWSLAVGLHQRLYLLGEPETGTASRDAPIWAEIMTAHHNCTSLLGCMVHVDFPNAICFATTLLPACCSLRLGCISLSHSSYQAFQAGLASSTCLAESSEQESALCLVLILALCEHSANNNSPIRPDLLETPVSCH